MFADSQTRLPVNGITVLDLTLARGGPTAVRHFADWGANVIRIEPPAEEAEASLAAAMVSTSRTTALPVAMLFRDANRAGSGRQTGADYEVASFH